MSSNIFVILFYFFFVRVIWYASISAVNPPRSYFFFVIYSVFLFTKLGHLTKEIKLSSIVSLIFFTFFEHTYNELINLLFLMLANFGRLFIKITENVSIIYCGINMLEELKFDKKKWQVYILNLISLKQNSKII